MRTLEKNKTSLWLVTSTGYTDKVDIEGNKTGDKVKTFSTPVSVRLSIYPATGEIIEAVFGKDASMDMVAVSTDVVLTKDSLLFETQPSSNYTETYTYKVTNIQHSINGYRYGLSRRA